MRIDNLPVPQTKQADPGDTTYMSQMKSKLSTELLDMGSGPISSVCGAALKIHSSIPGLIFYFYFFE